MQATDTNNTTPTQNKTPRYPDPYQHTLLGQADSRFLTKRPARIAFFFLMIAILLVACVQFVVKIQQTEVSPFRAGGERHKTALGRWLPDAEALTKVHEGEDPYSLGHWFPTPPMVLMTIVPFSKMGFAAAGILWAALKLAGLYVALSMLVRVLGPQGFAVPVGVMLMTAIYATRPIVSDITHGNLNIFMMVWLAIAWSLYIQGKDFSSGIFLAMAIVTKITPGLVLVYFIYKRAWRACIGTAVGLVLFVVILPSLYLGFHKNTELHRSWFEMLVAPYALHGYVTVTIPNQSLYGVSLRLLSNAGIIEKEYMPPEMTERAGVEDGDMARPVSAFARLLRPCFSLAFLGFLAWACRSRTTSRRDVRLWLEFSLILLAMLLMSERTWKHHGTTLPIVYLSVWYALTCIAWTDRFRAWFAGGFVVQLILLLGTSEGLLGDRLAQLMLDGGVFCWGLLLCFIQIGIMLRRLNRSGGHVGTPCLDPP